MDPATHDDHPGHRDGGRLETSSLSYRRHGSCSDGARARPRTPTHGEPAARSTCKARTWTVYTIVDGTSADVDVSASELLDHLDMAGMMALRSEKIATRSPSTRCSPDSAPMSPARTARSIDARCHPGHGRARVVVALGRALRAVRRAGAISRSSVDLSIKLPDGASDAAAETKSLFDPVVGARGAWPTRPGVDADRTRRHRRLRRRLRPHLERAGRWPTGASPRISDWCSAIAPWIRITARARAPTDSSSTCVISGPLLGLRYNFNP